MAQKNVTRDMTQGSPLKLILTFSLPLLGGFLFQQLYSFMDTMVVGGVLGTDCLLYTSPSLRDISGSRMPSSA